MLSSTWTTRGLPQVGEQSFGGRKRQCRLALGARTDARRASKGATYNAVWTSCLLGTDSQDNLSIRTLLPQPTLHFQDVTNALALDSEHSEALKLIKTIKQRAAGLKEKAIQLHLKQRYKSALQQISLAISVDPTQQDFYILRSASHPCVLFSFCVSPLALHFATPGKLAPFVCSDWSASPSENWLNLSEERCIDILATSMLRLTTICPFCTTPVTKKHLPSTATQRDNCFSATTTLPWIVSRKLVMKKRQIF